MPRQQPEQQAPPVQRLRVRYAKRGRLRFTSHRDVSRAVERAVVRAGIPMAYSSGFHPHPRISYAGASPTGAASEAEYLELGLADRREPAEVGRALDEALPAGLDVLAVVESPGGALADRLTASRWVVELRDADRAGLEQAVARFVAAESVTVERMTKKGLRSFDCRAAVAVLTVATAGEEATGAPALELVLRHTEPAVRPDDVLRGLAEVAGFTPPAPPLLTRLAQGPLDEATDAVGDPLG
ncbi:TIGR03936 family radical SAM-associated protein [Nocardioides sp. TF02-7]|uniref:TIGR03936 family radical SAM-associated protein n=1 Tax=Nocardioides sp. TF02-7 TaxID=2917724 RepID=UPI001F059C75|nr:TIGR03936 family radical SAM-associated protein [Nocardioides sp. TF02-7]UMG93156.1 TIGR03936 family radical SAM-associated protein [Nocardioides sp. TF02-7]